MTINKKTRLLCLIMTCVVILSAWGCTKKEEDEIVVEVPSVNTFMNPLPMPDSPDAPPIKVSTGLSQLAAQKNEINGDTVGWLHVPNTLIDEQVMFYPDPNDKFYYLRKDFDKRYSWEGSYFADFRATFNGGREGLSRNTTIYGHSMEDDPEYPLFSQLKKLLDPKFAENTPYIYFSTNDEDMVWEIFAVFITTIEFDYITPDEPPEEFEKTIDGARSRSIYSYENVKVNSSDKIVTLSTCIYNVNGTQHKYPNKYRYVVMGKLIPAEQALKSSVEIIENTEIKEP